MATISAALSTSTLPELNFLSPKNSSRRLRSLLSKRLNFEQKYQIILRNRRIVVAAKRDEATVLVNEKENEFITQLNGSVNGSSNGSYGINGSVLEEYTKESVEVVESESDKVDGNLVKYVNGNGNGNGVLVKSSEEVVEVKMEEEKVKKSIEEIGQEEAWFKKSEADQVEVRLS